MESSKKEVVIISSIITVLFSVIILSYIYLLNLKKEKINSIGFLIILIILSVFYLWAMYKIIKKYKLKNKSFEFIFYLINEEKEEIIDKEFLVYPKASYRALTEGENFLIPKSSRTGKVIVANLPGGIYRLAFRDSPRNILGEFGVKHFNQKKMVWYKTLNKELRVKKKRRLWVILKEEVI